MFGLFLRAVAVIFVGLSLAGCGTHPKPAPEVQQIYDIRGVAVTANKGISPALLRGIKQRLDKAIADTNRPAPLPRAVMNVSIVSVSKSPGYEGTRTETEVSVTLTDVPSGQALVTRGFLVYSFSISPRDANESAAEAIASRLRVEYSLSQPPLREQPAAAPRLSTQMDPGEQPVVVQEQKPLVVPLKTAPEIGVDQDPMLNSKTKVAPEKQVVDTKPKVAVPADNAVEAGAKTKVVIKAKATEPAADEPCVETMDKKC